MRLHRATVEDVQRIMPCAREFTAQLPDCELNEPFYGDAWRGFIGSGRGVILLLEDDDGDVAGGIGGLKTDDILTGGLMAVELFWYVRPEYRQGTWPVRLLKEFEAWAHMNRCQHVCMIHMEASMPEKLKQFYTRSGYTLLESVYRKRI